MWMHGYHYLLVHNGREFRCPSVQGEQTVPYPSSSSISCPVLRVGMDGWMEIFDPKLNTLTWKGEVAVKKQSSANYRLPI